MTCKLVLCLKHKFVNSRQPIPIMKAPSAIADIYRLQPDTITLVETFNVFTQPGLLELFWGLSL